MRRKLCLLICFTLFSPIVMSVHCSWTTSVIPVGRSCHRYVASWYGLREAGNYAASGERFSPFGLTAASLSLPFGTRVRVTNLRNGLSVVVRVNDRGPAPGLHRDIDLSWSAARRLRMLGEGLVKVHVELVR